MKTRPRQRERGRKALHDVQGFAGKVCAGREPRRLSELRREKREQNVGRGGQKVSAEFIVQMIISL